MSNTEQIKVWRTTAKGVRIVEYAGPRNGYQPREDAALYNVVRFYKDGAIRRRIIKRAVFLSEAQAHCQSPETSSSTCAKGAGKARTRRVGDWFDGYEQCR